MKRKYILSLLLLTVSVVSGATGFEELRALGRSKVVILPENTVIECISVSDYRSENLEINPNTKWNKVDVGENCRTAYVESEDGKYGLRLKFKNISDCRLVCGQKIKLDLSGCTLLKENDPERYTVSGLSSGRIKVVEESVPVPRKIKSVSELVDNDVYTQVIIKDLEISSKSGSYCNINEKCTLPSPKNTYSKGENTRLIPAMDGWATLFLSSDGCPIYMLVNSRCPWRRDDLRVKTGVGPIRGIIVHTDLPRFGGNIGKYAIRPLFKSDLILSYNPFSFYEILADWNWDHNYYDALNLKNRGEIRCLRTNKFVPADSILPDVGSGELYSESGDMMSLFEEYNSRVTMDGRGNIPTGGRDKAALCLSSSSYVWYGANGPLGIVAKTKPNGITGRLVIVTYSLTVRMPDETKPINFPKQWKIQYSNNGSDWKDSLSEPSTICPLFYRVGEISLDAAMGYAEHYAIIPSECLSEEELYVRLLPISAKPSSNSAFQLCLGSFTIRVLK